MKSLKSNLTNILGAGLVALGGAGMLGGCVTAGKVMQTNPRTHYLGSWTELAGTLAEDDARRKEEKDYYRTINALEDLHYLPIGLFTFNEWKDWDNNGTMSKYELSGLGKTTFNIDKEAMRVALNLPGKSMNITYRAFNDKGEKVCRVGIAHR